MRDSISTNATKTDGPPAFWDATDSPGFLKAGFLGFPKSGKTFTAVLLACAAREILKLTGPLAMFDTESGSGYIKDTVMALTGKPLLVKKARSFADLLEWGRRVAGEGVSVGIADSITHPWRELCDAYLAEKNEALKRMGRNPRSFISFDDWAVIKPKWAEWSNFYLNSSAHLVICGRAGWEYDKETDEETGKKELLKTGVKMKTETEFGFEPSLLVYMEADQKLVSGSPVICRRATVIGDRFHVIDAAIGEFESTNDLRAAYGRVMEFFGPHVERLRAGTGQRVDLTLKTKFGIDETGDAEWQREKRAREILCEEIQGTLVSAWPGMSAEDKKQKTDVLQDVFGTRSWSAVENMRSDVLRENRSRLETRIREIKNPAPVAVMPTEPQNIAVKGGHEPAAEAAKKKGAKR